MKPDKGHLILRRATPQDAPALARLNTAFNQVDQPADQIAARLSDPYTPEVPILAEIDGQAVAFAAIRIVPCVFYPEPHAELTELYVEPAFRRQGIARRLLAYAEKLALQSGASAIIVLTGADNIPALGLYHASGYREEDLALQRDISPRNQNQF